MSHIIDFSQFSPQSFMTEYWQKKPLLIKNAFADFQDPIDADELAGLAMEECIESRIVANANKQWQVAHGPFEDFSQYGEENWTLLVQAVNNWNPDVNALIDFVHFIPRWRIDDVMVSFSTPGAGVGPHLDQYDVFIIQGQGKRRWRVGDKNNNLAEIFPHEDLKQVEDFTAIIDEITTAGDILYIPPGFPHDGVAIENSLNYSIGFQAPHAQELISAFADRCIDLKAFEQRFTDANREVSTTEIMAHEDVQAMTDFMLSAFKQSTFMSEFLGQYLTKSHHELEVLLPEDNYETDDIIDLIDQADHLVKVNGIKSLIIEDLPNVLFINGENFPLDSESKQLAQCLLNDHTLTSEQLKSFSGCLKNVQLLTSVINRGYWFFE